MAGTLTIPDYVVIVFIQVFCAALGLFLGRKGPKEATVENYILGGRTIPPIPVGFSIVATTLSAVAMSQGVSEIYLHGIQYIIVKVGAALACIVCVFLVIPTFYRRMYVTLNEYIGLRFGQVLRVFYTIVYLISYMLYLGAVLYIPAMALSTLASIPFAISVCASGALCIFYCFAGGMRAIIWTDTLQLCFMNLCLLVVMIQGTINVGGASVVIEESMAGKRMTDFIWSENQDTPYSVYGLFISGFILLFTCVCASQAGFQRVICVESYKKCKITMYTSAIMTTVFGFLVTGAALVVYTSFRHCDPLKNMTVSSTDELLVFYIHHELDQHPGLKGLALSGIFCGSLSTLSSYINSFAAVMLHDLVKVILPRRITDERTSVRWCQAFTLGFGIICIGVTFLVDVMGGVTEMFQSIVNASGGPLLAIVCLAMFNHKLDEKGASIALVIGLFISIWIAVGSSASGIEYATLPLAVTSCNITDPSVPGLYTAEVFYNHWIENQELGVGNVFPLYRMSPTWYAPLGFLITITIGVVLGVIPYFQVSEEVDSKLFSTLTLKKTSFFAKQKLYPGSVLTKLKRNTQVYTVSQGNTNNGFQADGLSSVEQPIRRPDIVMYTEEHENAR